MNVTSSASPNNSVAYHNGRVYTVDKNQPWAEAFIVTAKGVFEAVGTDEEILAIAAKRSLVRYNLRKRFVMPGIHDAHTHLLLASMQALNEAAMGHDSSELTLAPLLRRGSCACAYTHVAGDWVVGNFYQAKNFPNGKPDRKYLDEHYPNQPVLIRELSCHRILLNTEALRRAGIDPNNAEDPKGGYYGRREDGTLTGEVIEQATTPFYAMIPLPPLAYAKRALEYGIQMCHRYGVTSCQEAGANTLYLHAASELEQENRLNLDVYTHIVCGDMGPAMEGEETLNALLDVSEAFASKHLHTKYVKFMLDGSFFPPDHTQCDLTEEGKPDHKLLVDYDTFLKAASKYDQRGMTCKAHVTGMGSARHAIDVFEKVRELNPNGPRHELAHCSTIHDGKQLNKHEVPNFD